MKKGFSYTAIIIICVLLCGCASEMSKSSRRGPDLNVIKAGISRNEIEAQLGKPIITDIKPDGTLKATYEYELGAMEAATYRGDAPVEKVGGNKFRCVVIYDRNDKVISADRGISR